MADFQKTAAAIKDYKFQWSDWLEAGEIIASYTVTPEAGITVDSHSKVDGDQNIEVWLSGGTLGETYCVVCEITTNNVPPRTDSKAFSLEIVDPCDA